MNFVRLNESHLLLAPLDILQVGSTGMLLLACFVNREEE